MSNLDSKQKRGVFLIANSTSSFKKTFIKKIQQENDLTNQQIIYFENENDKTIKVESIRDLVSKLNNLSLDSKYIVILDDLDEANKQVQSALLKLLEDKSEHFIFLLFVTNPHSLINTIISRSNLIIAPNSKIKQIDSNDLMQKIKSKASLFQFTNENSKSKTKLSKFLDDWIDREREIIISNPKNMQNRIHWLKSVLYSRNLVKKNNINIEFAIDNLAISYFEKYKLDFNKS